MDVVLTGSTGGFLQVCFGCFASIIVHCITIILSFLHSLLSSRPSSVETLRRYVCSFTSLKTSMLWWGHTHTRSGEELKHAVRSRCRLSERHIRMSADDSWHHSGCSRSAVVLVCVAKPARLHCFRAFVLLCWCMWNKVVLSVCLWMLNEPRVEVYCASS